MQRGESVSQSPFDHFQFLAGILGMCVSRAAQIPFRLNGRKGDKIDGSQDFFPSDRTRTSDPLPFYILE